MKFLAALGVLLIRIWSRTLRLRIEDRAGIGPQGDAGPVIWALWHNRILIVPYIRHRFFRNRHGAVLTSPSRDGAWLARVVGGFGLDSVRGSSSRRGAAALVGLVARMRQGQDICITPDGPRGPKYELQPGIVQLARSAGVPVMPISVRFQSCWKLPTWDGFRLPKPFSRVTVIFGPLHHVPADGDGVDFEKVRADLENVMKRTVADGPDKAS